jgi:hypothetical protein
VKQVTITLRELKELKRNLKHFRELAGSNAELWARADNRRKAAESLAESLGREVNEWKARFEFLLARCEPFRLTA